MNDPTVVTQLLRAQSRTRPADVGIVVDGAGPLTYGAWEAAASQVANVLLGRGVGAGERVAIAFTNDEALTFLICYLAVLKAGGVVVPLDTELPVDQVVKILDHTEARGLVVEEELASRWEHVPQGATHLTWMTSWRQLAHASGASGIFVQVGRTPDDLADLLYGSGATGPARAVASTHENVISVTRRDPGTTGSTLLHALPLSTFAGLHAAQLTALADGARTIVQPRFEPRRFLELIAEHRVESVYATPSMLRAVLDEADRGDVPDVSSLVRLTYGTAPMPPATIEQLARRFPGTSLVNEYALTEGGAAVCALAPEEALKRPGSVGKPLPPTELRILTRDGAPGAAGEIGEIQLRSPSRRRYFKDEATNRDTWTADGWLRTGDLGSIDEDGFVYVTGRAGNRT